MPTQEAKVKIGGARPEGRGLAGTNVNKIRQEPPEWALAAAASAAQRLKDRKVQIRKAFVRASPDDSNGVPSGKIPNRAPPLVRCLRGGRAGGEDAVRLKLYLSLLWMSAGRGGGRTKLPSYATAYPASAWAHLIGLEDPDRRGKRRISEALHWLAGERLVTITARRGSPPVVVLMEESGSGRPYSLPGAKDNTGKAEGNYILLPATFWTNGWLQVLSGPALAVMLALMAWGHEGRDFWISPGRRTGEYGLSEDTWRRGKKELEAHGLVSVRRKHTRENVFQVAKRRDWYELHPPRLSAKPGSSTWDPRVALRSGHPAVRPS